MSENKEKNAEAGDALTREIGALKAQIKDLEEMADMMPVVTNFQEHLEEERQKSQNRLLGVTAIFVVAVIFLLAIPVYLARKFTEEIQTYQKNQAQLELRLQESFSSELAGVQKNTVLLIRELAQDRKSVYDALKATAAALNGMAESLAHPPAPPPPEPVKEKPEPEEESDPPRPVDPPKTPIITPDPDTSGQPVGAAETKDVEAERGRLNELLHRVDKALQERKEFRKELLEQKDDDGTPKG